MTILSLHYFLVAAEELNFTTAAQKLYVTQQTLSSHIKRLEEEYGALLFERKPKLHLTMAGQRMVHYAKRIIRLERLMTAELVDLSKENSGALCIGCSRIRAKSFLPMVWSEYHRICPNINIQMRSGFSSQMSEFVLSGVADIAMSLDSNPEPYLIKETVLRENLCFVITPDLFREYFPNNAELKYEEFSKGVTWKDIRELPLLLLHPENHVRRIIDQEFAKMDCIPRALFETNDSETIFNMALSGCGATVLYDSVVFFTSEYSVSELDKVYVFPIIGAEICTSLVYPSDVMLPHYEQVFVDVCKKVFAHAKIEMNCREQEYSLKRKFR